MKASCITRACWTLLFAIAFSVGIALLSSSQAPKMDGDRPPLSRNNGVVRDNSLSVSPVIGILSQPSGGEHTNTTKDEYIIAASYVKWLEAGGARSIPIPYDAPLSMVEDLFGQINGLLLPGGASDVPESVYHILALARQASASNDFFPVWGTCLGFEYLAHVLSTSSSSTPIVAGGFDAENISLPLNNVLQRQLYEDHRIHDIVTNDNVTMNNHFKGVEPQTFENDPQLNALFEITSTNVDRKGRQFVSTIEPRNPASFPWYGVQYHPEKNAFEYASYPGTNIPYEAINHSEEAVDFSAFLSRFFVGLSRGSFHAYTKPEEYPLIGAFPVKRGLGFEESFIIPSARHWSPQQAD